MKLKTNPPDIVAPAPSALKTTTSRLLLGVSRPFGISHELTEMAKDSIVESLSHRKIKKGR